MALTELWDATKPADSRAANLGAQDIREQKRVLKERMINGGHHMEGTDNTTDNNAGKHACGIATTDSGITGNQWRVYENDKTTNAFLIDEDANVITFGDGVDGSNGYALSAQSLAGERYHTLGVAFVPGGTGRVDGVMVLNRGGGVMRVVEAQAVCFGAPSGGAEVIDIHKLTISATGASVVDIADEATNPGSTILNAALSIANGDFASDLASTGDFASAADYHDVAVGDALFFEVDTHNGASEVFVFLKVRRIS